MSDGEGAPKRPRVVLKGRTASSRVSHSSTGAGGAGAKDPAGAARSSDGAAASAASSGGGAAASALVASVLRSCQLTGGEKSTSSSSLRRREGKADGDWKPSGQQDRELGENAPGDDAGGDDLPWKDRWRRGRAQWGGTSDWKDASPERKASPPPRLTKAEDRVSTSPAASGKDADRRPLENTVRGRGEVRREVKAGVDNKRVSEDATGKRARSPAEPLAAPSLGSLVVTATQNGERKVDRKSSTGGFLVKRRRVPGEPRRLLKEGGEERSVAREDEEGAAAPSEDGPDASAPAVLEKKAERPALTKPPEQKRGPERNALDVGRAMLKAPVRKKVVAKSPTKEAGKLSDGEVAPPLVDPLALFQPEMPQPTAPVERKSTQRNALNVQFIRELERETFGIADGTSEKKSRTASPKKATGERTSSNGGTAARADGREASPKKVATPGPAAASSSPRKAAQPVAPASEPLRAQLRSRPKVEASSPVRKPAPAPAAPAAVETHVTEQLAVFDVCGKTFKIPAKHILKRPNTVLAQALEKDGAGSSSKTVFVDTSPDRFTYILDWFRYGEIHLPRCIPVGALLQDAQRLRLPEELTINGMNISTRPNAAQKVSRAMIENVSRRWPRFKSFFGNLLESIEEHYRSAREDAPGNDDAYDIQPYTLLLYENEAWVSSQEVCNATRARVLALKLEERGYLCSFTDAELVVSLPLQLRGEAAGGGGPADGFEEEEMEEEDPSNVAAWNEE